MEPLYSDSANVVVSAATKPVSNTAMIAQASRTPRSVVFPIALTVSFLLSASPSITQTSGSSRIGSYQAGQIQTDMRDRPEMKALAKVREIGAYQNGWHGPDSLGPSQKALDDAEKFLLSLDLTKVHSPFITLTEDGEINFIWKLPTATLDLGFMGDGTYSYFCRTTEGSVYHVDDKNASHSLPENILALLSKTA